MEQAAIRIVETLRKAGFTAYFAGGCVRDMLLGKPAKDIDIATDAKPEQVQRLFPRNVAVGAQFGVICVLDGEEQYEVATFRSDGEYIDGRRPESVVFSSAELDAQRRDFTINGLFYDPIAKEVIDYVGGKADLERKVLRAIGDPVARFAEDKLRMLRAVRFGASLGFEIEDTTWKAVQEHAPAILSVSRERIREELVKIFLAPTRGKGFDLLDASGLMKVILPDIERLKGCEQPPQFHPEGDVYVHTRIMLGLLPEEVSLPLVLSVLFHDIGKPATYSLDPAEGRIRFNGHDEVGAEMTERIMRDLHFSNQEIDATVEAVRNHMVFKDVKKMRVAKLKRFMARPTFEEEMELHRVDCASSHNDLGSYRFLREKQEEFASEPLVPPPLVTGHDLIALGWKPSPALGKTLETIQNWQLEGAVRSREEALARVQAELQPT